MSSSERDGHAAFAHFAFAEGVVGVIAHERGQIEGHGESGLALAQADRDSGGWSPPAWRSRRTGAWSRACRDTCRGGCRECTGIRRGYQGWLSQGTLQDFGELRGCECQRIGFHAAGGRGTFDGEGNLGLSEAEGAECGDVEGLVEAEERFKGMFGG